MGKRIPPQIILHFLETFYVEYNSTEIYREHIMMWCCENYNHPYSELLVLI